ncbi:MAG: hypothetical protein WBM00_02165, partial [Solirubrobacterales bacterium]
SLKLGAEVEKAKNMAKVRPLISRLNDKWEDSNADIIFSDAVTWALVYDCMLVKLIQRGAETLPFLVDPGNFGVLREDVTMLDRQEAFVHVFMTTKSQLQRDLATHPNREVLLMRLTASKKTESELPAGVQRIIMSTIYPLSGTMTGNAPAPLANEDLYRPRTAEELVECYELWLWDDGASGKDPKTGRPGGYRCVTLSDPSIVIYDRLAYDQSTKDGSQIWLEGEHPFTQVKPNPAPDYFWGYSEVAKLTGLQDQREHHMGQATELVDRSVNSPKAMKGNWGGAIDEKNLAVQKMNALISSIGDPTADIKEFKPSVPADLWQLVDRDDQMFQEASALTNLSMGRGEAGVRSKGQTDSLMRASSSRPKKRALIIEDSLERIAMLYMKLDQAHNKAPLTSEPTAQDEKPEQFLSAHFTNNYMVKVDGHSSSPVFMEEKKGDMLALFDRGIVDGDAVLETYQPQNTQGLKERYKELAAARAAAEQKKQAMEQAEAAGKLSRLPGAQG